MKRSNRRRSARYGAAALELALVLPLLITLVLAAVDLGRFAYSYIAITNAARTAAGFASVNPLPVTSTTQETWRALVKANVLAEFGSTLDASKVAVSDPVVTVDNEGFKRVRVDVSYTFETIVAWPLLPTSIQMTRGTAMPVIR